jgi:hypothetical protein
VARDPAGLANRDASQAALRSPASVHLATVSDSEDEISSGRPDVDHAVVAWPQPEESGKLASRWFAGPLLLDEGLLDLLENAERYGAVEPIQIPGDRGFVLNPCGGQSASSDRRTR